MARSGAKYIAVSVVIMAVGVVCAYLVDQTHGKVAERLIEVSIPLCLGGAGLFLLGLFKVAVGLFSKRSTPSAGADASEPAGDQKL